MTRSRRSCIRHLGLVCILGLVGCAAGDDGPPGPNADATATAGSVVDPALVGAIDIHAHLDPDGYGPGGSGRFIDALELAHLARDAGMRGFVIKQHYDQTADDAYWIRQLVPELEVFGGIGLNLTVGGLNVAAVRQMADVKGGWGRLVWMPTWDARHYVTENEEDRPYITVARGGELTPEARAVIETIAELRTRGTRGSLALATGHNAPEEGLLIVREARRLGLQVVVTHPLLEFVGMSIDQMKEVAGLGGYLEFVSAFTGSPEQTREYVQAIREVGPEHCIVSSDRGQGRGPEGDEDPDRPTHVDGLAAAAQVLRENGFTDRELDLMFKENPARLLGLPVLGSTSAGR